MFVRGSLVDWFSWSVGRMVCHNFLKRAGRFTSMLLSEHLFYLAATDLDSLSHLALLHLEESRLLFMLLMLLLLLLMLLLLLLATTLLSLIQYTQ